MLIPNNVEYLILVFVTCFFIGFHVFFRALKKKKKKMKGIRINYAHKHITYYQYYEIIKINILENVFNEFE